MTATATDTRLRLYWSFDPEGEAFGGLKFTDDEVRAQAREKRPDATEVYVHPFRFATIDELAEKLVGGELKDFDDIIEEVAESGDCNEFIGGEDGVEWINDLRDRKEELADEWSKQVREFAKRFLEAAAPRNALLPAADSYALTL